MHSENIRWNTRIRRRRRTRAVFGRVLLLLGTALAAFLLLATLYGRIRLTALNDEAVVIATSIEQHRHQRAKLLIDHESIYELGRVESYAREELGMQRPRGDQLQYLDSTPPDRVTLYRDAEGISILDSIAACFR